MDFTAGLDVNQSRHSAISPGNCPPVDVLAQLVSGSLEEKHADELFKHIDSCPACQQRADQLAARADSLLQVVAHADKPRAATTRVQPEEPSDQLDVLIRRAQELDPSLDRTSSSGSFTLSNSAIRVGLGGFLESLRRSSLLEEALFDEISAEAKDFENSSLLAQHLLDTNRLTHFQAKVLLRGRWKGLVLGNYVVLEKLGEGGMGNVFKAKHRRMGRIVCIKVMNAAGRRSPAMLERFRNEARTVAALNHPNIVIAHDADESEGIPFLVMEYIRGVDLANYVGINGPLPIAETIDIALQVGQALDYAHGMGVVHRDIKPHNLLMTREEETEKLQIKILDMGLARFDSFLSDNPDASTHAAMTDTGMIMGTVDYMSPEQAIDSRQADNRSDIYSLGCTLHFLLTGQRVYEGETMMARLVAHREQPVPSLAERVEGLADEFDSVFQRMIAKHPDERYSSMQDLVQDLAALKSGVRPPSLMPTIPSDWSPTDIASRRQRSTWPMWLGATATVCFCIFLFEVIFGDHGTGIEATTEESVANAVNVPPDQSAKKATETAGQSPTTAQRQPEKVATKDKQRSPVVARKQQSALLVLPPEFVEEQKRKVTAELEKRGVQIRTGSLWGAKAVPLEGSKKRPPITTDINLQKFSASEFQSIIFVGGACDEMLKKDARQEIERVIHSASKNQARILAIGNAWEFIGKIGAEKNTLRVETKSISKSVSQLVN